MTKAELKKDLRKLVTTVHENWVDASTLLNSGTLRDKDIDDVEAYVDGLERAEAALIEALEGD